MGIHQKSPVKQPESYRMLAFGGAMTVMMVLRPAGLIPASRRKRELETER